MIRKSWHLIPMLRVSHRNKHLLVPLRCRRRLIGWYLCVQQATHIVTCYKDQQLSSVISSSIHLKASTDRSLSTCSSARSSPPHLLVSNPIITSRLLVRDRPLREIMARNASPSNDSGPGTKQEEEEQAEESEWSEEKGIQRTRDQLE